MTKKDYDAIAKIINARITNCEGVISGRIPATAEAQFSANNEIYAITSLAEELADHMQNENPNFNREKFLQYCGIA